jgi:uncharacterized protein involved in outer membrane biogenesis
MATPPSRRPTATLASSHRPGAPPPSRRRGRRALVVLAVLVAIPAAGYGTLRYLLRDDILRPRLLAAVEQATGRSLTLSGPIGLKLSLVPTVTLDGVAFANPPGASRPDMLTARRVEAKLALIPLLSRHVAFERVTLIEPDLLLEMDAEGRGNWRFTPARPPGQAPTTPTPAEPAANTPLALSIAAIGIEGGRIGWRDPRSGRIETLEVRELALTAPEPTAPIDFEGQFTLRGVALASRGQAGPLPRLLGTQAEPADWPLRLTLAAPGIQAVLDGAIAHPEAAAGWRIALNATADRADRLAPFLKPGTVLPPLTELDLQARLADAGPGAPPDVQSLRLHTAGGDLGTLQPGLRLGASTIAIAGSGQPATAAAALTLNGEAWQVEAGLPPLPVLLSTGPWQVTAALRGEGTAAQAQATLSGPRRAMVAGRLSLQAADTLPLSRSLALPLPQLQDLRLDSNLSREGARLAASDLHLEARGLALEGEASVTLAPRRAITARLNAPRINLDELTAAAPVPAAPHTGTPPATPAIPAAPAAPITPAPPPPGLIPAIPLPLEALKGLDANIQLNVGDWIADGILYRDQRITLALLDGRLALDPVSLGVPGGRLALVARADANAVPPSFALSARHEGAGIELRPLLQAYRLPAQSSGRVEIETELTGAGPDLRAVAASLNGPFAVAMANGQIDNSLLDRFAGDLRRLLVPNAPRDGSTALSCLALRVAFRDGIGRPEAMLLETSLANITGSGEIDLKQERLNLRLLPQVRIAGVGISAPVRITGTFANPGYRLDQGGAAQAAAGILGELAARQRESSVSALGQLAQELAGRPAGSLPDCAQQLAVARGGRSGPVPAAEARPQQEQRRVNPADLLRGLLGR